jgi:hypothetical protein
MVKDRKKEMSHDKRMILSSQVNRLTIKYRDTMRAKTKIEARTRVAAVTAKTAGPRFAIEPPGSESESGSMAAMSRALGDSSLMVETKSKVQIAVRVRSGKEKDGRRGALLDVGKRLMRGSQTSDKAKKGEEIARS